jgi:acyl-CoA thioester hydrolase
MGTPFTPLVPDGAYCMTNRVRSYEAGRSGSVGLGTILRYLEHLATEASTERGFDHQWYEHAGTAWVVRDMDILLGAVPGIDDDMTLATWLSEWRRVQARREYAIWWPQRERLIARASARWAYVDRRRGQPTRIPQDMLSKFGVPGRPMLLRVGKPSAQISHRQCRPLPIVAHEYEADSQQHINNCVYADWLEEAARSCRSEAVEGQWVHTTRYYHIEYVQSARPGDAIRVDTQATTHTRLLHLTQTITNAADQRLYVRAWSQHLLLPAG